MKFITVLIPLVAVAILLFVVGVVSGLFAYRDSGAYAEEVYSDTTEEEPEEEDDEQQETIVGYKCKNCGAPIHFNNGDSLTTCEYCKHQMKRRL